MTERDLKEYLIRKKEVENITIVLKDFESRMLAVGGNGITGMPFDNPYPEDKMAIIANRHDELRLELRDATAALTRAQANITLAMMFLYDDERAFFKKRYVEGKSYEIIMREMHISRPTSCRIRCKILERVKPL